MKIIESIALHFMSNTVTVHQNATGFCLNDIHRAYTGGLSRKKKPSDWIKWNLSVEDSRQFEITKHDRSGTYANEQGVYAYAAWLDAGFHAAVIETFAAAARGDGKKAVTIAQSAVTLTLREALKDTTKALNDSVDHATDEGVLKGLYEHNIRHIQGLACKAVTGLDAVAFKNRYGKSARNFLCAHDDAKRLGLMTRIEGKIEGMLDAGMCYIDIKGLLSRDILKAQESWCYEIPKPIKKALKEAA